MDLLVIASTAFSLLLALMREQRAALITELDRKGVESENQRRMLETVFDSMSDGVVIVDSARVSMYNAAARQLLGRPMPAGTPALVGRGLRSRGRGRGPSRRRRAPRGSLGRRGRSREDAPGHGRARRRRTHPRHLRPADRFRRGRSTMVLLHDVTAQRARMRELSNFAGMVAHDLRGPLTVLDGWLEVVEDGDPVEDEPAGRRRRPQGPGVQPPDAPGDRGLAELHRRPERPAAPRGREAVRCRQRDRRRPPGQLGRR